MSQKKVIINTQGGSVYNECNFNNVEIVAQKIVYNEAPTSNPNPCAVVDAEAELVADNIPAGGSEQKKRRPQYLLFKSEQQQAHWSHVFVDFLKKHNRSSEQLTTSADAFINRALACFYMQWKKNGLLNDSAYDKAPTLFLFDDCGIKGVDPRTHSNRIKTILDEAYRHEQSNPKSDMIIQVKEVVRDNI